MTKLLKRYSNQKIKRFLFFLGIAGVFWVLTKFSREFTSSMQADIRYQNLPETAVLSSNNAKKITYDLTANGFEILFYKFKRPVLDIEIDKFYTKERDSFAVPKNEILQQLEAQFNKYLEVRNLNPDPLIVKLDPVILKKVKVVAKTDIDFRNGFKGVENMETIPDSVVIAGPQADVEKIDSIFTQVLTLRDVHRNISEQVGIALPPVEAVAVNPENVLLQWDVSEFSQEQFTLPVEIINLPPGMELKLVPAHVTVTFDISIDDFKEVSAKNFKLICDFAKRNDDQNFMLPELVKKPEKAVNIALDPKKIDYFIFKN